MAEKNIRPVSLHTIRRLPSYRRILLQLQGTGREVVSCTHIASALNLDPAQVRKDLWYTDISGNPRVGYGVSDLLESIERFLGWNNTQDAFLIGAGSLGSALMGYNGFSKHGLNIIAAFDTDPEKVGKDIHGKPVYEMNKLKDLSRRIHVRVGVLATPASEAQEAARYMTENGIMAIWNFTQTTLHLHAGVIVENVDLSGSFAVLCRKLNTMFQHDGEKECVK